MTMAKMKRGSTPVFALTLRIADEISLSSASEFSATPNWAHPVVSTPLLLLNLEMNVNGCQANQSLGLTW
jgi:hypothetical protein